MDCKNALIEANGDMEKAIDVLRQQGMNVAMAREDRTTDEGIIASYIHAGSQIGVLVEVRCETDFVAKTDEFQEFAHNVAMQIAAMNPKWITPDDVSVEALNREKAILKQQALQEGKPEHIIEKIIEGRMKKFYSQVCLMKQPYIKNDSITVEDKLNELIAQLGEKVFIKRFIFYKIGDE
jgi:elongation factor Ts